MGAPPFDLSKAQAMIGQIVLVGLTYVDTAGEIVRRDQLHGVIGAVDRKAGLRVDLQGTREGEVYWLPPDLRSFKRAPEGEYRLKQSGTVVTNPDWLTTWTVRSPDDDGS